MTGILEMFSELSQPDEFYVAAQLELFCWRRQRSLREIRRRWARLHPAKMREFQRRYMAKRYATDEVFRLREVARQAKRYATDADYRERKRAYARERYHRLKRAA